MSIETHQFSFDPLLSELVDPYYPPEKELVDSVFDQPDAKDPAREKYARRRIGMQDHGTKDEARGHDDDDYWKEKKTRPTLTDEMAEFELDFSDPDQSDDIPSLANDGKSQSNKFESPVERALRDELRERTVAENAAGSILHLLECDYISKSEAYLRLLNSISDTEREYVDELISEITAPSEYDPADSDSSELIEHFRTSRARAASSTLESSPLADTDYLDDVTIRTWR